MTIKQHHIRSLLSRYTYSSNTSNRRNRRNRHRHYTTRLRRHYRGNDASLFNNAVSKYLNLQGFGRGPSKNKRYGPILDPSLLLNNTYADNNNGGGSSDDDDVIKPKLDKYYISNFLSFLPEDLVKDVMSQRINSRQSTILKYLRQTYDCYPPQIYKLVTGHRLSNKDLRQYRLRQPNNHHDTNHPPAAASLPPTPPQAPVAPPMDDDNDENVDAATQLEQLMHDYHSAESVMADVFDEMSRVVANTVATPPSTTNQRIAHKAILPAAQPQSYIPHKQMMPPSPPPHIPYKQMPPPTPPPSSPSSSSSLSPPSSVVHDDAQQQQQQPTTNHYQDLLDSMDMYLNNLPSSSSSTGNQQQQQQQQQPQSFTNVLNAYCDGYFNAKETVNEVLHVAQQYLMNTWDKQQGGGM